MRKYLIFSIFLALFQKLTAQEQAAYVQKYQDLAISEMLRSGIPASIKLAQAMLESDYGRSELATKANNHFGIKCGGEWNGKSMHREDDDYKNGKLVKSCFREFNSVIESYVAHSDFLADPAKESRYGSLFDLEVTDYKGWAMGLSKAGYATDPQYARRLISLIEQYELYRFDNEYENAALAASKNQPAGHPVIRFTNDVMYTVAQTGDNPDIISKRHDVSVNQLMRFNDDIIQKNQELKAGTKVYLRPKKNKYNGKQKYHLLKDDEDMIMIAQLYGIKLDALLRRNSLKKGDIPASNQKIYLNGKAKTDLRKVDPYSIPDEKKKPMPEEVISTNAREMNTGNDLAVASVKNTTDTITQSGTRPRSQYPAHTVSKGETLYSISRTYGISIADLKKMNNLPTDTIYVGQKLALK